MQINTRHYYALFALIFTINIFSCTSTFQSTTRHEVVDYAELSLQDFDSYSAYGAAILYDEGILEVSENAGVPISTLKRRRAIKIFDKGKFYLANIAIPYSGSTKITELEACTLLPNGNTVHLAKSDIFDVTMYPQYIFYSDIRAKKFAFPAVEEGCIIEYRWTKVIQNYSNWDRWYFQNSLPTVLSRFQITLPKKLDLKWQPVGHNLQPTIKSENPGASITYRWELRDLEPIKTEPAMPAGSSHIIGIRFSPFGLTSWQKINDWFRDLTKARNSPTPMISLIADSLVSDTRSEMEKLRRLYQFVRDRIRYVAISIGIGGYQPHYADWVLRNRYGDCKDKVTLLSALAASQSISVNYVLVSTAQNGRIDSTISSHAQFNHVIARAHLSDGTTVWMDPTELFCPFGELPWYDKNRLVLEVSAGDSATFVRTTANSYLHNSILRCWELTVDSTHTIEGKARIVYQGDSALLLRKTLFGESEDYTEEFLKKQLFYDVPFASVNCLNVSNLFNPQEDIEITFRIRSKLQVSRENIVQADLATLFSSPLFATFVDSDRRYPVSLPFPFETVDSIRVNHKHFTTLSAPETALFDSPNLRCIFSASISDSSDSFVKTVQLLNNEFQARDYDLFFDNQRNIFQHSSKPYLLKFEY